MDLGGETIDLGCETSDPGGETTTGATLVKEKGISCEYCEKIFSVRKCLYRCPWATMASLATMEMAITLIWPLWQYSHS